MTPQEVFDKVVSHLRQQGCKSIVKSLDDDGRDYCMYRGPNGLKCAVGVLIEDSEYDSSFERDGIQVILRKGSASLRDRLTSHERLLAQLQEVHDCYEVTEWEKKLARVAQLHDLKYTAPSA